jgi:uncharacterized membrane protein YhaH (DUF805 family)
MNNNRRAGLTSLFGFSGKASRKEFVLFQFWSSLPSLLIVSYMLFSLLSAMSGNMEDINAMLAMGEGLESLQAVSTLLALVSQVICLPVTTRRLNDMALNKWWSSVSLIPFVNWIFCIVLMAAPSRAVAALEAKTEEKRVADNLDNQWYKKPN